MKQLLTFIMRHYLLTRISCPTEGRGFSANHLRSQRELNAGCYEFGSNLMHLLLNILVAVQILSAVGLVGLILLQHGKGADMGAAFGSGASGSLFGATRSAHFLSRSTAVLATVFFACTLALAYFGNLRPTSGGK